MAKDLRQFLDELQRKVPDEFVTVERAVNPKFELPAVLRKLQDVDQYPAVHFKNVKGSQFSVVSNLFASTRRLGLSLGADPEHLVRDYLAMEGKLIKPKLLRNAPVHQNVITGRSVDLGKLPVVTHCEKDAAPYLTCGVAVMKDPDTGVYDVGIFRLQVKGKNKLGALYGAYSKAARIIRKNEAENRPTEVAVFVGHHPACVLTSQTKVPVDVDEFWVMGGLLGEPIELVKAKTIDVRVPARAEFVLECEVKAHTLEPEGPFGEYPWYYGHERLSHVLKVNAITHRNDAIYHDLFSAHPDHNMAAKVQREAVLYKRVKQAVPGLKAVELPVSGTCRHLGYVSIRKDFDGQGKIAAMAALVADPMMKHVVIVDDDIDVKNESEVWWAVTTRTQADKAIFMVPDAYVSELDPSAYSIKDRNRRDYLNTKWAIDATKPIGLPFEERADVPRDMWEKIKLSDYIPNFSN
jgi:2,5-furandicarboxylate decarboxylase 1